MSSKLPVIQWKKRSKTDQTLVSDRRIWESRCGLYRVIFSQIRYGRNLGKNSIPDTYYAMIRKTKEDYFNIISKHRKKNPAFEACEKVFKRLHKESVKDTKAKTKNTKRRSSKDRDV